MTIDNKLCVSVVYINDMDEMFISLWLWCALFS